MIPGHRVSHNDAKVLLYLYHHGEAHLNKINKYVLKHPQRTQRVVNRLIARGFIEDRYVMVRAPEGQGCWVARVLRLTDKGKKYVEEVLLKCQPADQLKEEK